MGIEGKQIELKWGEVVRVGEVTITLVKSTPRWARIAVKAPAEVPISGAEVVASRLTDDGERG